MDGATLPCHFLRSSSLITFHRHVKAHTQPHKWFQESKGSSTCFWLWHCSKMKIKRSVFILKNTNLKNTNPRRWCLESRDVKCRRFKCTFYRLGIMTIYKHTKVNYNFVFWFFRYFVSITKFRAFSAKLESFDISREFFKDCNVC